jgi:hypothetical protein
VKEALDTNTKTANMRIGGNRPFNKLLIGFTAKGGHNRSEPSIASGVIPWTSPWNQ